MTRLYNPCWDCYAIWSMYRRKWRNIAYRVHWFSSFFLFFFSFFDTLLFRVPLIRRSRALFNEPLNLFDTRNYAAPFTASESRRFDLDQTLSSLVAAFGNKNSPAIPPRLAKFFPRFWTNRRFVHSALDTRRTEYRRRNTLVDRKNYSQSYFHETFQDCIVTYFYIFYKR